VEPDGDFDPGAHVAADRSHDHHHSDERTHAAPAPQHVPGQGASAPELPVRPPHWL
jgi:hypothetical protein